MKVLLRSAAVAACVLVVSATQQASAQSLFVPIAPCRIVDTRGGTSPGAITGGTTRTFNVVGVANYSSQGGTSGSCNIPGFQFGVPSVVAIAVNVVAVTPAAQGNLLVYPTDVTPGTSSTLNFPGPAVPLNIANGVIVPVRQDSAGADVTVRPTQTTHVIMDVTGYFSPVSLRGEGVENVIGGYQGNWTQEGVSGATIWGGSQFAWNYVTDNGGVVAGGAGNVAGDSAGTVNDADWATVGGGHANVASGETSTVPGGSVNKALGDNSFAAGEHAVASHTGSFMWAGGLTDFNVATDANYNFKVFAAGGVSLNTNNDPSSGHHFYLFDVPGFNNGVAIDTWTGAKLSAGGTWTNNSDVHRKHGFEPVDERGVVDKVAALPVSTWHYDQEGPTIRHMGPTAQDFHAAFGLGADDAHIATIDESGVTLAAIKGLYQMIQEDRREMKRKDAEIARLRARIETMAAAAERASGARLALDR